MNLKWMVSGIFALGLSSAVLAGPMSWESVYDPEDVLLSGSNGDTVSWTFDITADGFNPSSDWVSNYGITLDLYDDGDRDRTFLGFCYSGCEYAFFDQPGVLGDGWRFEVDGSEDFGASLVGLVSLNLDGTLGVSLTAQSGDFWFGGASLVATGQGGSASVPEPSSMALVGLGLAALGFVRRRRA